MKFLPESARIRSLIRKGGAIQNNKQSTNVDFMLSPPLLK